MKVFLVWNSYICRYGVDNFEDLVYVYGKKESAIVAVESIKNTFPEDREWIMDEDSAGEGYIQVDARSDGGWSIYFTEEDVL